MKIAILVRGFHYLKRDRYGYPLEATEYFSSFEANMLLPLQREHEVKVYLSTYLSPVWHEIEKLYAPTKFILLDPKKFQQVDTMQAGLEMIREDFSVVDRIICTRFDIDYLQPVSDWNIWTEKKGLFLPWREYEIFWKDHQRVGDFFHIIDREVIYEMIAIFAALTERNHMHQIYASLEMQKIPVYFMESGFYDSNTYYSNAECFNPLYRIANRPRIFIKQPITASTYIRLQILNYLERIISMHMALVYNSCHWLSRGQVAQLVPELALYLQKIARLAVDFVIDMKGKLERFLNSSRHKNGKHCSHEEI